MQIDMRQLHDKIFDYLNNWSEETQQKNRYFYLRTREDERFKKGYWFLGDENYLAISFWAGLDYLNKTPNIYLEFRSDASVNAFIIGRDSDNKLKFFEKEMVKYLPDFKFNVKRKVWKKYYGKFREETIFIFLDRFINNEKVIIDERFMATLDKIDETDVKLFEDDFSSKVGFISENQFLIMRNRVESMKLSIQSASLKSHLSKKTEERISILYISIINFHGIEKLTVDELPEAAKWIFLTGENGFGKTSLLRAISLGLTSYGENENYLERETKISVRYSFRGEYLYRTVFPGSSDTKNSLNDKFIAYGPMRLITQSSSSDLEYNLESSNINSLFNRLGLLKNVTLHLLKSANKKNPREFDNLKNALIKVLDGKIRDIKIDKNIGEIVFCEVDINGDILGWNQLENLATGFQGIINLVGDIIARFSQSGRKYSDFNGIVIIDELENHLHPNFQRRLPGLLSTLFPKIQFIASIHSPIPLLGAPKDSLIIRVDRDAENGITAQRITIDNIETLNPNILFSSPIFGFTSLVSDNLVEMSKFRTEDSWQEMEDNDELDKKLIEMYNKRKRGE